MGAPSSTGCPSDDNSSTDPVFAGSTVGVAVAVEISGGLVTRAGIALTGVAAATTATAPASCASSAPHLTVEGTGQGSGTPDVLSAVFGFSTTASSSAAALSQNNTEVALALQALTSNGVARRDTQTTGLNLSAQYAYPHGVPTLTGYQATETITATLRKASTEGTAIDDVVNATGNAAQVNSLTFSFGNPAVVQDKARTAHPRSFWTAPRFTNSDGHPPSVSSMA